MIHGNGSIQITSASTIFISISSTFESHHYLIFDLSDQAFGCWYHPRVRPGSCSVHSMMAGKRLIVRLDGTTNDGINQPGPLTNVARISRCIEQENRRDANAVMSQIVYYRTGIGTGTSKLSNTKNAIFGRGKLYTSLNVNFRANSN